MGIVTPTRITSFQQITGSLPFRGVIKNMIRHSHILTRAKWHAFCTWHFQSYLTENSLFLVRLNRKLIFSRSPVDIKSVFVKACRRTGNITWTNNHDDVIKWKHFPRYWPFVRGIHRSPVNSPHKGQWRGALLFSLICTRINDWENNREASDLRRHGARYDVTVMKTLFNNTQQCCPS